MERRAKELWNKLCNHPSSSIRQLASTKAEQKGYYRFLNNETVKEEELIKESSHRMSSLAKGRNRIKKIKESERINNSRKNEKLF